MSIFKNVIKFSPCVLAVTALASVLLPQPSQAVELHGPGSPACTATEFDQCTPIHNQGYTCSRIVPESSENTECTDCNNDRCYFWQTAHLDSAVCSKPGEERRYCKKKTFTYGGKCAGYCPSVGGE